MFYNKPSVQDGAGFLRFLAGTTTTPASEKGLSLDYRFLALDVFVFLTAFFYEEKRQTSEKPEKAVSYEIHSQLFRHFGEKPHSYKMIINHTLRIL